MLRHRTGLNPGGPLILGVSTLFQTCAGEVLNHQVKEKKLLMNQQLQLSDTIPTARSCGEAISCARNQKETKHRIIKSIRKSFMGRGHGSLATSLPMLLLAFAFATSAARAQEGNTATGVDALVSNTTGDFNTAIGLAALLSNSTGANNTANGFEALASNSSGNSNTATGLFALYNNATGTSNTATGLQALGGNTTGGRNTTNGDSALLYQHDRQ